MVYTVYTDKAIYDEHIPNSCKYYPDEQPAGSGRVGFRVDYDGCGTGSQMTNGLYPRLIDQDLRVPTLEMAYQQFLWKSRLAGPFVSIWRSWSRALRWARYLKRRNCHNIMIHAVDLEIVEKANPIYDARRVIKELHNLNRGLDLATKNHFEELIVYNGVDDSTCAIIASIPAGSDNVKVAAHFANVLIPKEFHEDVQRYADSCPQARGRHAVQLPPVYGHSNLETAGFSYMPLGGEGTFFDALLSRLYLGTIMRRGYVDKAKLIQMITAMCTDFSQDGKRQESKYGAEGVIIGKRPRTDSVFTTMSTSTFASLSSPV
ncbi:hypothetical protein Slin14017_G121140 [Septoria linicola]|nr:hypothetical protein Slin14017_G121140 [Septoria linicola]